MNPSVKLVIFITAVCSLTPLATALCKCFECAKCTPDPTTVCGNGPCIDGDAYTNLALAQSYKDACENLYGCYRPAVTVEVYPAVNYDETNAAWKRLTIALRPFCCFTLPGPLYDNTLSSIKTTQCVNLYDSIDCTGTANPISVNTPNINVPYPGFNDKASSISLC